MCTRWTAGPDPPGRPRQPAPGLVGTQRGVGVGGDGVRHVKTIEQRKDRHKKHTAQKTLQNRGTAKPRSPPRKKKGGAHTHTRARARAEANLQLREGRGEAKVLRGVVRVRLHHAVRPCHHPRVPGRHCGWRRGKGESKWVKADLGHNHTPTQPHTTTQPHTRAQIISLPSETENRQRTQSCRRRGR